MDSVRGGDDTATRGGTVDPERFARVREIFEAALEQPAAARAAFVARACVGEALTEREVLAMLAADAEANGLLDLSAGPTGPAAGGAHDARREPGRVISDSAPEEGRFPAGTVLAGR
jgi:hypothetical protein